MRRREWLRLTTAGALASIGLALLPIGAAATRALEPLPVEDAVFAWSLSQQTNARSHNPLALNFLSAGVADPGRGGALLTSNKWTASAGNVEIQKLGSTGAWAPATWDGLGTDAAGEPIDLYGPFSGHRVRIAAGTGTLSSAGEDARIAWQGTFTVVYYGGNSVFTLSDPVLDVVDGRGTVTAVAGGWSTDRNDPTVWNPVDPQSVTVATLVGVDVTDTGISVAPTYDGVEVSGTVPQTRTGKDWGSFPASLVAFLGPLGIDQFWYSTGLESDWTKPPEPISVSWKGAEEQVAPPTVAVPAKTPTAKPTNTVKTPPTKTPPSKAQPTDTSPSSKATYAPEQPRIQPAPAVTAEVFDPSSGDALGTTEATPGPAPAWTTPVQVTATSAAPVATDTRLVSAASRPAAWWIGGGLLLAAAALLLLPIAPRRPH